LKVAPGQDITALLRAWSRGEQDAGDRLVPLVYDELRRQAARYLRRERRREHTLRPTALVHEAYVRLAGQRKADWKNRAQFFGVAANVMRRVLVDHARRHGAAKRAGSWCRVTLDEAVVAAAPPDLEILALERALQELETIDPGKARLVELRFYGGLDLEGTAAVLGVSVSTVTREWRLARAWLYRRLSKDARASSSET
jgi:RNA polymerase sigma factor (TIGR02999 family)